MIDYGISNDIVMDLQDNHISIEQLKEKKNRMRGRGSWGGGGRRGVS